MLKPADDVAHVFRRLQRPGSKIVDLRCVEINASFFERLADGWQAPPGMVPRLALVLDYERWVIFRNMDQARLASLRDREVEIEIVYAQLLDHDRLSAWFERGRLVHAMPAVIDWLRSEWRPTEIWAWVLDVTARMIEATASVDVVPQLLLDVSDLARVIGGQAEGAAEAAKHAQTALNWLGNTPSASRSRALRAIATCTSTRSSGASEAAIPSSDATATRSRGVANTVDRAWELVDLGMKALGCRRLAAAEAALERAAMMAPEDATSLRAMIHQQLARALAQQAKRDEATQHAKLAAELRSTSRGALTLEQDHRPDAEHPSAQRGTLA